MTHIPIVPESSEPLPALRSNTGLLSWVASVDHKQIGIMYLLTTTVFLLLGGIEALLMRIQLAQPEMKFLSPTAYNQVFTMHGTTMVFLVVMPILIGFGTYLIPLMIGARDMIFPRLNALSYWLLLFGGCLLYFSFMAGGMPNAGWFSYTPLSQKGFSSGVGVDYWILGLLSTGIGTLLSAVNFIATIMFLRAPGMSMLRMPLFVWMSLINSFLILGALAILNSAMIMLFVSRHLDMHILDDPLLWQHLFWAFGHPEVYIMVIPAFGMLSEIIPVFSRKLIFGYAFVAGSGAAIAILSFIVWAHHMFAVGMSPALNYFFSISSMLIAVPTGVKIFNWVATLLGGSIRFTTAMLFCTGFLLQFTMGGVTGVTFATVPIDWQTTDTYYVVAHMHYVLFGGSFFGVLGAAYYWFPKITGHMLNERIGKWHFWLTVLGFNATFMVQHFLGLMGMPRRVYTYPDLPGWGALNLLSTIGAFILAGSVLLFIWNVVVSLRHGEVASDNPWNGWTLEWATSSPPPVYNFDKLPPITSHRPLWDQTHTTPTPEWIPVSTEHMPQPGYWPAMLALGMVFTLWGLVTTWMISVVGALLIGVAVFGWIGVISHDE